MKWPPETSTLNGHDYGFTVATPPPPGYPETETPGTYSSRPFAPDYETRRQALIDHILRNPAPNNFKSPYAELVRVARGHARGQAPHEGIFLAACDFIDARKDCSDFVMHALLRLVYQFPNGLPEAVMERVQHTILGFKYWPDEPGIDSLCTWTENHQILYASAAYLAGLRYPEGVFGNADHTGQEKAALHRPRILRWLDLRIATGFSEWLSNVYYDEDLTALVNLLDFAPDAEIREKSERVIDLMLLDLALNSFQGVFGSTHGRSYENSKKWAWNEATTDTCKLLFGMGVFSQRDNMAAACLALSPNFRLPPLLFQIANDPRVMENRQRMGIRLAEAERWGLDPRRLEDGLVLLSLEAYLHLRTAETTMRLFDAFRWWENNFFEPFRPHRGLVSTLRRLGLLGPLCALLERDVCRNTREEVNLVTYRTAQYMLSSAPDYRPGFGGDQQHIWQATLKAGDGGWPRVVFTTHPARRSGPSPAYWTGSGTLPRVAQVKNVLIALYRIDTTPGLYLTNRLLFTHAWLPRDQFDEVLEDPSGWILARSGEAYLALRSRNPYTWQTGEGEDAGREIIAEGKNNVWVCELGSKEEYGSWEAFTRAISSARVEWSGLGVRYQSPAQGQIEFGWKGPCRQNGQEVRFKDFPRYDNPYLHLEFPLPVDEPVLPFPPV